MHRGVGSVSVLWLVKLELYIAIKCCGVSTSSNLNCNKQLNELKYKIKARYHVLKVRVEVG